ncbi:MAG: flotillin family protein [Verrucomicrobiales bacterium]
MLMFIGTMSAVVVVLVIVLFAAALFASTKFFRKVEQGQALVRNGLGGTKVSFSGTLVFPIVHQAEYMDISVKRVEIDRNGKNGLICMDNLRADIKVAFFVRVNQTPTDVLKVAQSVGCIRASSHQAIAELFDSKFSEALKTVGRQFHFVDLYNSRDKLKEGILRTIGTDLNGFVLEDVAIDYLEQTSIALLNPDNILDSEGIKKITELTAQQKILANKIDREKERTITQQNVETQEAIFELNRQLAEADEKQKREIANIKAREEAEAKKIQQEQRLRSEQARIAADEEIYVAEENKNRQIIVAQKNKERTEAVEIERVEKDRLMEVVERERIVTLATIEKNKVIEVEQKNIQDVIRERLMVEKTSVEEKERIKDVEAFAEANRQKKVLITRAEMEAEQVLVKNIKAAEADKKAAELHAEQAVFTTVKAAEASKEAAELKAEELLIVAEAEQTAASKQAAAKKSLAEAVTAETAASGLAEAQVLEAKAAAVEKQGSAEARILEMKATAEARGITAKADAMKLFDGVGRQHEEFKLRLNKDRDIELAQINIHKDIAANQAHVLAEALKHAKIDIVGGEAQFFDRITKAITLGKSVDRALANSESLTDIKETFFNSDPDYFFSQMKSYVDKFGLTTEDLKNLTVSAALGQMISVTDDSKLKTTLNGLLSQAHRTGMADKTLNTIRKDGAANVLS